MYYVAFSTCEESVPNGFPKYFKNEVKLATAELGIKNENLIIKNFPVRNFHLHRQKF